MMYITKISSFERKKINRKIDSDIAFRKMANDLREEIGGTVNYALVNDGAYEVVKS